MFFNRKYPPIMGGPLPYYTQLFDEGSALSIANDDATHVRIAPYKPFSGSWGWFCIKYDDLAGKTPHFVMAKANAYGGFTGYVAVWATGADRDTWNIFDNVTVGAVDLEWWNNTPFPAGMIYISFMPEYPFSRVQRKVSQWTQDSRASNTPSSTNFIIGYTTQRNNGDLVGRIAPALPYYAFKLTNPSGFTKNKAILSAYNHPSETPGPYELEGAIDWLLSGDPEAELLLDWFEFYIYPCLNPQGVYGGYFRSNPQQPTYDHNRYWNDANKASLEDTLAFRNAMDTDTGGAVELAIDFHMWWDTWTCKAYTYSAIDAAMVLFSKEMLKFQTDFAVVEDTTATMLANVYKTTYAARLAFTLEAGNSTTKTPTDWKGFGVNAMRSITAMLVKGNFTNGPAIAAREFNGLTDRIDFTSIYDTNGLPFSCSMWILVDAYPSSGNGYLLGIHATGDTAFGHILGNSNGPYLSHVVDFLTTDPNHYVTPNPVTVGAGWLHVFWTRDNSGNAANWHTYENGIEVFSGNVTGVGAEQAHNGKWSIGGRIFDDTRNLDGRIAYIAVWDEDYHTESAMILGLATGRSPAFYHNDHMRFFWKGDTSSLYDEITSTLGVADGTTMLSAAKGIGPAIIQP